MLMLRTTRNAATASNMGSGLHPWNETQIISVTGGCHDALSCLVLRERGFELKGRLVSERRVQPVLVVDLCDEAIDAAAGVTEIDEGLAVDLFGLERLHEAFGLGVVEGIAGSAHADGDVVFR